MDRLIVLTLNEKVNDFAVTSAAYAVAKRYIGRRKGMEERVDSIPLLMTKRIMSMVNKTWHYAKAFFL